MRAKRTEGEKKGTGTRKEQKGEGNRKELEARGLDQEDVRPGRSGEAEAKAGGPGPAHVRGHFRYRTARLRHDADAARQAGVFHDAVSAAPAPAGAGPVPAARFRVR